MVIGEIDQQLKDEIDDVQMYIDYLWEQDRGSEVPAQQKIRIGCVRKLRERNNAAYRRF